MLKLYYNANNKLDKKVLAYIQDSDQKNLAINILNTNITGTIWTDIAENLGIEIKDLIDVDKIDSTDKNIDLENVDWLKVLDKTPNTLKFPILINGNYFYQIKDAQSVLSLI